MIGRGRLAGAAAMMFVLAQASGAPAVTRPYTQSQASVYQRTPGSYACQQDSGFVNRSTSADCGLVLGPSDTWQASSSAAASYTGLGAYALAVNDIEADAVAQWSDLFTVSGPSGGPTAFSFHLLVSIHGSASVGGPPGNGQAKGQLIAGIIPLSKPAYDATGTATVTQTGGTYGISSPYSFESGNCNGGCEMNIWLPYDPTEQYVFNVYLSAQAIGQPGQEAIADFAHTVSVDGIGLYDSTGHRIDGAVFNFASGASYPVGPDAIPEPRLAAMVLAALAALGVARSAGLRA